MTEPMIVVGCVLAAMLFLIIGTAWGYTAWKGCNDPEIS